MSTYKCSRCGVAFDEPFIKEYRENLDGEHGWWTVHERLCPVCGSEDIEKCEEEETDDEV